MNAVSHAPPHRGALPCPTARLLTALALALTLAAAVRAQTDRFGDPLPPGTLARVGTVRFRPGDAARFALSADGKALATAGGDTSVRLWDVNTGRELPAPRGLALPRRCPCTASHLTPH
ncbi:MAG: hypothetical protein L0Z62_01200 [Gemmataceae bacterium]|nr:hypothetical protein [Gemmataceae bacterium]